MPGILALLRGQEENRTCLPRGAATLTADGSVGCQMPPQPLPGTRTWHLSLCHTPVAAVTMELTSRIVSLRLASQISTRISSLHRWDLPEEFVSAGWHAHRKLNGSLRRHFDHGCKIALKEGRNATLFVDLLRAACKDRAFSETEPFTAWQRLPHPIPLQPVAPGENFLEKAAYLPC